MVTSQDYLKKKKNACFFFIIIAQKLNLIVFVCLFVFNDRWGSGSLRNKHRLSAEITVLNTDSIQTLFVLLSQCFPAQSSGIPRRSTILLLPSSLPAWTKHWETPNTRCRCLGAGGRQKWWLGWKTLFLIVSLVGGMYGKHLVYESTAWKVLNAFTIMNVWFDSWLACFYVWPLPDGFPAFDSRTVFRLQLLEYDLHLVSFPSGYWLFRISCALESELGWQNGTWYLCIWIHSCLTIAVRVILGV